MALMSNSATPPLTVALPVVSVLMVISPPGSRRTMSPSSFAFSTISPASRTLASMVVMMAISMS